jgi:hypothetical protein
LIRNTDAVDFGRNWLRRAAFRGNCAEACLGSKADLEEGASASGGLCWKTPKSRCSENLANIACCRFQPLQGFAKTEFHSDLNAARNANMSEYALKYRAVPLTLSHRVEVRALVRPPSFSRIWPASGRGIVTRRPELDFRNRTSVLPRTWTLGLVSEAKGTEYGGRGWSRTVDRSSGPKTPAKCSRGQSGLI